MIRLPANSPHSVGQRLVALGLVNDDMVLVALIESRLFGQPMETLLVSRKWLDNAVLQILVHPEIKQ